MAQSENAVTQMDLTHAACSYAWSNGASRHNAPPADASKQATVCFQSDPHVADRMLQTHRTSRSKAVDVLKLAHMFDVIPQQVLKAAVIDTFTPTVGQMMTCDSSQINRESSSALQFCSALCSTFFSLSLLFWFSISKNTVKHPTAPKPAKYFGKTKLSGELFLDL